MSMGSPLDARPRRLQTFFDPLTPEYDAMVGATTSSTRSSTRTGVAMVAGWFGVGRAVRLDVSSVACDMPTAYAGTASPACGKLSRTVAKA